jgi:hypothetical protein
MNKIAKREKGNSSSRKNRSSNLELLGGVSAGALRRIRDIAARADLPLERVFRDVVAIGVSVVSDPSESPYQSLIAFRSGLAAKQEELEKESATEPHEPVGSRSTGEQAGDRILAEAPDDEDIGDTLSRRSGPDGTGFDDAALEPGQWPQDEAGDAVFSESE